MTIVSIIGKCISVVYLQPFSILFIQQNLGEPASRAHISTLIFNFIAFKSLKDQAPTALTVEKHLIRTKLDL